ncbi:MAG: diadenylate cyclase CdaA [Bacteroidota bacterium]|nr:diadenylate cyclase CdaA [Bacteroidota bacterium]MDP3144163.1 diadenylate cyclase CdaA [Bacteroidota bacterium]MDP3558268.1 diadenylate cyclase CdaA [Bacteroidota bacterium]
MLIQNFILFISFGITDAIDILLVAVILYLAYNLVKGTSAVNIFIGLALIYLAYIVIKAFDLKLLSSIIGKFVNVGVIAVMIVFQQEIRKFLLYIGSNEFLRNKNWKNIFKLNFSSTPENEIHLNIEDVVEACFNMSKTNTGALIIIARKSDLKFFITTGDLLDAGLTSRMLENIFFKNSPLHDGAVIIQDNRIVAARCVLPVTEKEDFPANFGLRHRAAVGITENTDAIAISVSEQTGAVSFTMHAEITANINKQKLTFLLEKNLKQLN